MKKELEETREQIQEDILSYLNGIDPDSIMYTEVDKDNICQIIVENFEKIKHI